MRRNEALYEYGAFKNLADQALTLPRAEFLRREAGYKIQADLNQRKRSEAVGQAIRFPRFWRLCRAFKANPRSYRAPEALRMRKPASVVCSGQGPGVNLHLLGQQDRRFDRRHRGGKALVHVVHSQPSLQKTWIFSSSRPRPRASEVCRAREFDVPLQGIRPQDFAETAWELQVESVRRLAERWFG